MDLDLGSARAPMRGKERNPEKPRVHQKGMRFTFRFTVFSLNSMLGKMEHDG